LSRYLNKTEPVSLRKPKCCETFTFPRPTSEYIMAARTAGIDRNEEIKLLSPCV